MKENITKEICKECGKSLSSEEKIYDGYCEKCWNKWINKRTKRPKEISGESNKDILASWSFFCGTISIMIMLIIYGILALMGPIFAFDILISILTFEAPKSQLFVTDILFVNIVSIIFGSIGILLGLASIDKQGKNKFAITGIVLSVASCIFGIFINLI